jgi:hypothetical protein
MPTVKLGRREFDVDSEEIDASYCGVSDADCVAFAARMTTGEIVSLKYQFTTSRLGTPHLLAP